MLVGDVLAELVGRQLMIDSENWRQFIGKFCISAFNDNVSISHSLGHLLKLDSTPHCGWSMAGRSPQFIH